MSLEQIKFNPYNRISSDEIVQYIEEYIEETKDVKTILLGIANKVYFDNSIAWEAPLYNIFRKYKILRIGIKRLFSELIKEKNNQSALVTLLTYLISKNLISTKFITSNIVKQISEKEALYIFYSFLSSWDLMKALELDSEYIKSNFPQIIDANKFPIREILLNTNDDSNYDVILFMLDNLSTHYHLNREIQSIIRQNNDIELDTIEFFIRRISKNKNDNVVEFLCDLLETNSIQEFLKCKWENTVLEQLYKNFTFIHKQYSKFSRQITLKSLNRLKERQSTNFAVAARYAINKLTDSDREFIIKVVEDLSNDEITSYYNNLIIEANDNWDWKDYAFKLLKTYKEEYSETERIDVRKIADILGIKIIEAVFETEDFDACLVRDNTLISPIIIINTYRKSEGRVNFSIAHEIAHATIPHHSKKNFFCVLDDMTESQKFSMDKDLEIEANNFASYLLVPDQKFKEETSRLNYTIENIQLLSDKYGASLVLIAKKWSELSNLEIAMLFSTNGIVDWWKISSSFPYRYIEQTIDVNSTVFEVINPNKPIIAKKRVSYNKWTNWEYPKYTLLEESIKIYENKALTLLQILDKE